MNWEKDLSKSSADFKELVWPEIKDTWFDGAKIIPVEAVTNDKMKDRLDQYAGIDMWELNENSGMRGIASRVQWTDRPWNSFTIRKERATGTMTEYEKRRKAIFGDRGYLYPEITIQAYINESRTKLLSVGGIKTKFLFQYVENNDVPTRKVDHDGKAIFYYVHWDKLEGRDSDKIRFLREG